MFGDNPIRKVDATDTGEVTHVQEIFYTIQGEGPSSGTPAAFVRLNGCSLKCSFCDTDFESDWKKMTAGEIVAAIEEAMPDHFTMNKDYLPLVVITGGEPLRQNISKLVDHLIASGYRVEIETSGSSFHPGNFSLLNCFQTGRLSMVCSPKTDTVNAAVRNMVEGQSTGYYKILTRVADGFLRNGSPCYTTQKDGRMVLISAQVMVIPSKVFVQPITEYRETFLSRFDRWFGHESPATYAIDNAATKRNEEYAAAVAMRYGFRLSLQVHKLLNLP